MAFGGSLSSTKVPWRGGLVRAGRFDCLTEPGIVGGIVATRTAHLSHPARNDSALRGPRGSFEAACPDQPAPASPSKPFTSCTQRFGRTRPAREFRSGLAGPTRTLFFQPNVNPRLIQKKPPVPRRLASHFAGLFIYAIPDQSGSNRLSPVISAGFSIPRIPRMVGATSARRPSRTLKFPGPT